MEKMSSSNSQPALASKNVNTNGVDKGKQQDNGLYNQKQCRSFTKRRETFNNPKTERRPVVAAKKQPLERRGRQKGSHVDNWDDNLNVDLSQNQGSVGKQFSAKKHNLNHLLNFSFTPRESRTHESHCSLKYPVKHAKYNKGLFLQANCQFVVKQGNDYSKHNSDPDLSVDWDLVEEVRFNSLTSETMVCPICLHTPVAAKITKCGHIYCWSCILHYLALSDQSFRKCPICYDAIYRRDLRSVLSVSRNDYRVGDEITLSLMKRKRGSVVTVPLVHETLSDLLSVEGNSVSALYHKLLVASPLQVLNVIIAREREQLSKQLDEEKETPEACFIEGALQILHEREESVKIAAAIADEKVGPAVVAKTSESQNEPQADDKEDYYFFYQSCDGQHIYLHSLNVRMLCNEYGSLDQCPLQIKAKILEMEWSSMSDERRKRHRYMQHLPLTCEFRIVELNLVTPLVSDKTLDLFRSEINRRQKERRRKINEENKRDRNLKVEQQKKIHGIYPLPRFRLNDLLHFPVCSNDYNVSPPSSTSDESIIDEVEASGLAIGGNGEEMNLTPLCTPQPESRSFASMLKDGKARSIPEALNTKASRTSQLAIVEEEYIAKPLHQYSLSDAFEAALSMKDSTKKKRKK